MTNTTRSGEDFLPNQRFNVDQSPLPFVMQMNRTYEHFDEDQRTTKVWIAQPGAGLEKRQCTLQICLRAGEPPQMGKTIFFLILSNKKYDLFPFLLF